MTAPRTTLGDERDYLKILYHGEPGSGKTTAAAHMAHLGRVIWVLGENGLKRGPLERLGVPVDNIEIHREITYRALEELCAEVRAALHSDPGAYAGVVFDSLTEVQGRFLEATAKGDTVSLAEHGINAQQLTLLLRHYTDLACHVAFITHPKRDEDSDGEVVYRPAMSPKVSGILLGQVDVTCVCLARARAGEEEPEYLGLFRPAGKYRGKDRMGVLPGKLINPTFDRVLAYVDGTYRREALREAEAGDAAKAVGLDEQQFAYLRRVAAGRKASDSSKGE